MSAPTAPSLDVSPPANQQHLLASDSEKPSHASSLAGQKDADDDEATATATATTTPAKTRAPSVLSRKWALGPVVKDYGDYGLLACSFVTGMVDGASFLNWGVFVGMQTGEFSCCFSCFFGMADWNGMEWLRSCLVSVVLAWLVNLTWPVLRCVDSLICRDRWEWPCDAFVPTPHQHTSHLNDHGNSLTTSKATQ